MNTTTLMILSVLSTSAISATNTPEMCKEVGRYGSLSLQLYLHGHEPSGAKQDWGSVTSSMRYVESQIRVNYATLTPEKIAKIGYEHCMGKRDFR